MTTTLTKKQSRMLGTAQQRGAAPTVLDQVDIYADELPHHTTQLDIYEAAGLTRPEAFTLESHAAKIITIGRRSYIDIGRELLAAREIARHGTWRSFLERCGMPESTARNYMHVAERFAEKSATVALLPPAALYALSAPSADEAIVDAIVTEVEAGSKPTVREIKERLASKPIFDDAAFIDAQRRFAALGWKLVRHGVWFKLSKPDGTVYATTPDLAPQIATLEAFEQNMVGQRTDPNKADPSEPPAPMPEPADSLDDTIRRLDAHGYAKTGERTKGMTTFYTFRDYRNDLGDDSAGVIELAAGELPFWLSDLDTSARKAEERQQQYLDMQARFEALSWRLERDGKAFALYQPDGKHHGTTKVLDPMLKTLASLEKEAVAANPPPMPSDLYAAGFRWFKVGAGLLVIHGPDGWQGDAPTPDRMLQLARERMTAQSQRRVCPTCGETITNGLWGDLNECGQCYQARQLAKVDTGIGAALRRPRRPADQGVSAILEYQRQLEAYVIRLETRIVELEQQLAAVPVETI